MNLIFLVDVSYSMYDSLPKLRKDIKNNLACKLNHGDSLTIMWFSSRGQHGDVLFDYNVDTISDVKDVTSAIDKWLRPVGATCFEEVLERLVNRIDELPSGDNHVYFLTDGYDNQSTESNILKHCQSLAEKATSFEVLEYGYYCNTSLLEKMTAATNGNHHFIETYEGVSKFFDSSVSVPMIKYNNLSENDTLCYYHNKVLYKSKNDLCPEGSTPFIMGEHNTGESNYLKMYFSDNVYDIAKKLSDVDMIDRSYNAITYQERNDLKDYIKQCILSGCYYNRGVDHNFDATERRHTVIDFLEGLEGFDLCVEHEDFNYSRVGAKSAVKEDDTVSKLATAMQSATDPNEIREIAKKITNHKDYKPDFIPFDAKRKMRINSIDVASEKCNINLSTTTNGFVALPDTDERRDLNLPDMVRTFINRKYNIVKNGVINNKKLPLLVTPELITYLSKFDNITYKISKYGNESVAVVDVSDMYLVNRSQLDTSDLASTVFLLNGVKAEYKVCREHLVKLNPEHKSSYLSSEYGKQGAAYLSDLGIRDYGFSPKVNTVKSDSDYYVQNEVKYAIKGLSSLPKTADVIAKVDKLNGDTSKLTVSHSLLNKYIEMYDEHKDDVDWLTNKLKSIEDNKRQLTKELSRISYAKLLTEPDDYSEEFTGKLANKDVKLNVSFVQKTVYI